MTRAAVSGLLLSPRIVRGGERKNGGFDLWGMPPLHPPSSL